MVEIGYAGWPYGYFNIDIMYNIFNINDDLKYFAEINRRYLLMLWIFIIFWM